MANRILGKADPVLDLPLVDLEPLRFPPQPVRSPGALVANTAIRRKDEAEDEGEDPNPLIDFVAKLPGASATTWVREPEHRSVGRRGFRPGLARRPADAMRYRRARSPPSRAEPPSGRGSVDREDLLDGIHRLEPWFHSIELAPGVLTKTESVAGEPADHPRETWDIVKNCLPLDLSGKSVLDVGCNAGFYSVEAKRRNAGRVLGVDAMRREIMQANFVRRALGLDIEFRAMSVYDLSAASVGRFDVTLALGSDLSPEAPGPRPREARRRDEGDR